MHRPLNRTGSSLGSAGTNSAGIVIVSATEAIPLRVRRMVEVCADDPGDCRGLPPFSQSVSLSHHVFFKIKDVITSTPIASNMGSFSRITMYDLNGEKRGPPEIRNPSLRLNKTALDIPFPGLFVIPFQLGHYFFFFRNSRFLRISSDRCATQAADRSGSAGVFMQ